VAKTIARSTSDTTAPPDQLARRPPSRLWHLLLSAGTGDVAQFRGWDRLIVWRSHATAAERRHAVKRFLKLPARAAKLAYADVKAFGREVEKRSGVSRGRQFSQLWWLRARHGMDTQPYLDYRLYRPDRWPRAADYVAGKEFFRVIRYLIAEHGSSSDAPVLHDKRDFDGWCREHGFPSVSTLMEWHEGEVVHSNLAGGNLPAGDLFSKPADATGGHGTSRWLYDGRGGYVGADGRARQPAELMEELAELSRTLPGRYGRLSRRILLQPHLHNHHALRPLTSGALSTIRVVTYRFPRGEPQLLFAAYRLPVGNAPADNFHYGGIVAPVDLATGRLGPPIRREGRVVVDVERHPDTGAVIAGHQLPHWDETVRLVLRAHATLRRVVTVGWDVAPCEDGPVLVEGNLASDPDIAQAPSGVPLGDTPFVRCINAHVREHFGL